MLEALTGTLEAQTEPSPRLTSLEARLMMRVFNTHYNKMNKAGKKKNSLLILAWRGKKWQWLICFW